jgi:hypothetical protein
LHASPQQAARLGPSCCATHRVVNVASFAEVLGLLYTRTIPWVRECAAVQSRAAQLAAALVPAGLLLPARDSEALPAA